ncbi:MAG: type II toxin-antitoxin system VapC family toxin [Chlorogloeopsis fritschii C42_A2020_084]|uniref:type II toxin-antitoxin system VapC family toxin n=1 Tax=Chlorogloeopsis fritschii TaxID=1124 RepID=UPI001A0BBD5F|nr:type II toxin-antitoxin system VapC family toxin [Chlorogloeopsis fritschii]MBF2004000.1 type II toxin-antitoxin system VapC family toxin [Chlorogloeopsis fritschii C42_A2020_084]
MSYLLDTDTCIYWLNGRQLVKDRLLAVWHQVGICVITVAELYYGAYNSNRVEENLARVEEFIKNISIIPLDNISLKLFGQLKAELRRTGQPIADFDLLIASAVLAGNYILVTNNTRHYSRISGIQLENWTLP